MSRFTLDPLFLDTVSQKLDIRLQLQQAEVALCVLLVVSLCLSETILMLLYVLNSALHAANPHFKFFMFGTEKDHMLA